MKRQIVWSHRAEISYGHIIDTIDKKFGSRRALRYVNDVYAQVKKLAVNPGLGQEEPLLEGSRIPYKRLIIGGLTKVIYHVKEDRIDIADVWDTRMDPKELIARFAD